ncbi:MAG TPA: hypothetical protein VI814_03775 [Candidatus Limnocylindria bacterium]
MSRPWRLLVAGAQVVFALAFAAGLYLYLVGLAPELDLPLSAVALVEPSSREDRAGTPTVDRVVPTVEPPSARTAPPTAPPPPRAPNVAIIPPVTSASQAAPPLPVVAAEAIVTMSTLVFAAPGHAPHEHALPAQAAPRAVAATAHTQRPPASRA